MVITCNSSGTNNLLRRARERDQRALADLFARYQERLRRMVRLRLDRRLRGQLDSTRVLQEVYSAAARRFAEYPADPSTSFYLWLRMVTGQTIQALHQKHLGSQMWDAGQEVSLYRGALPQAHSVSLAAQLLGQMDPAGQSTARAEMQIRLQDALNSMDALDREVLALRHFEELNNEQTATVLGIDQATASNRYISALKRLKEILTSIPGFLDRRRR
jgi:RNA polymerase sigma-70 factor (ECF subfamily)